ncbi:MAG: hypothetical protein R2909_08665 [Gemmatimonadales bacterium]
MTWASSLAAHNRISANMGLYWSFMERCVDTGSPASTSAAARRAAGPIASAAVGAADETLW